MMDYETARTRIRSSLAVGVNAESDDPGLHDVVSRLTETQLDWISSWLAGEGFGLQTKDMTAHTEFGVKWVDPPPYVRRERGYVETDGTRPDGSVGQFSEDDCRYVAGTRQRVVARTRTSYVAYTEWQEVPR